ncbi:hypothetical protein [Ralstonia mannitolilytica]|uniref:hypothetical protein n=1 Tax=Ralstonia mannitolilytica TaxID=105219 RepID=UPI000C7A309D|nr:hypothetical protein [Ralstonia mannitolilytica]PLT18707.1 hypothetical protein CXP34_01500 [Ralstonia mannitolilytica]
MKTIEIKGWIFLQKYSWESAYSFQFSHLALDKHTGEGEVCIRVQEHTISVDVPDKIDTVSPQVKALEQKKEKLRKEFNARIGAINDQLSKLQALTFDAA